jgi:hypothetical protein
MTHVQVLKITNGEWPQIPKVKTLYKSGFFVRTYTAA